MSRNSRPTCEKDSRDRINTSSPTRRQAFNTAKDVNKIPRSQSPNRQYTVPDKDTGANLRQWEYTNMNAGDSGSKLNKQHHYYEKK